VLVSLLGPKFVNADYLEVRRSATLKSDPEGAANVLAHFDSGQFLNLLEDEQTGGYYHAESVSGGPAGWIYRTLVRRYPGSPVVAPPPSSGGIAPSPTPTGGEDASAFPIPNCTPDGNPSPNYSQYEQLRALNRLKNRTHGPTPSQVQQINLSAILAPGPDESRWSSDQAIRTIGWVAKVDSGGKETCNCKTTNHQYWDTHIELTRGPTDQGQPLIVEVTPEWRALRATEGKNWTTPSLQQQFLHQYVAVTGWLCYDSQHWQNAANTNQDGDDVWRQTAWEIHPITAIEIAPSP
jgi:hypothetical protein